MRIIIAGSRWINNYDLIANCVDRSGFQITEVISGHGGNVDKAGETWARRNRRRLRLVPARWRTYGNSAGYRRNSEMSVVAEGLIAIWDCKSRGTAHMINLMLDKRKRVCAFAVSSSDQTEGNRINEDELASMVASVIAPRENRTDD